MEYLGEDDHGIWLGARAGSVSQRGSEPAVTMKHAYVGLFALGEPWWVAYFNAAPASTEIYCDISTPPLWDEDQDEVTMSDLDLDVVPERGNQLRGTRRFVVAGDHRIGRGAVPAHVPVLARPSHLRLHLTSMSHGVYYALKMVAPRAIIDRVLASIEVREEDLPHDIRALQPPGTRRVRRARPDL